jgi:hypothetical protein
MYTPKSNLSFMHILLCKIWGCQVVTTVFLKIQFFWDVTLYRSVFHVQQHVPEDSSHVLFISRYSLCLYTTNYAVVKSLKNPINHSTSLEIPWILYNYNVRYHVYKNPLIDPSLCHMNPLQSVAIWFLKIDVSSLKHSGNYTHHLFSH